MDKEILQNLILSLALSFIALFIGFGWVVTNMNYKNSSTEEELDRLLIYIVCVGFIPLIKFQYYKKFKRLGLEKKAKALWISFKLESIVIFLLILLLSMIYFSLLNDYRERQSEFILNENLE